MTTFPSPTPRPGSSRAWLPAVVLALLVAAHAGVLATRFARLPAPPYTFHDHELKLSRAAMMLGGHALTLDLPPDRMVPTDRVGLGPGWLVTGFFRNVNTTGQDYFVTSPGHYLLGALLPALVGISPWTLRLGPMVLFALLLPAFYLAGAALVPPERGRSTGILTALLASFVPVVYQSPGVGLPTLGVLVGATWTLCALLRSDALSRLGWAAAAGGLLGLAPRWGETAGGGIAAWAALGGPAVVTGIAALVRAARGRRRGLAGAALAIGTFAVVADWRWLWPNLRPILSSRLSTITPPQGAEPMWRPFEEQALNYPEAVTYSLLGVCVTALVIFGALSFFLVARPRWTGIALLASMVLPWWLLTPSAKQQDYYMAAAVPAALLLMGVGTAGIPRVGRWLGVSAAALLGASWLFVCHMDLPLLATARCTGPLPTLLGADPGLCEDPPPTRMTHWFRRWRRADDLADRNRNELGRWLMDGAGRAAVEAIPTGSLVLMVRPGQSDADVAAWLGQGLRPDLVFDFYRGERPGWIDPKVPASVPPMAAMRFLGIENNTIAALPGWLEDQQALGASRQVEITTVTLR